MTHISKAYNLTFPPYEVLARSVRDFDIEERRSEIRRRRVTAGSPKYYVHRDFAFGLKGSLGDWYTGRPWLYVLGASSRSGLEDVSDDEHMQASVDHAVDCIVRLHEWYVGLVDLIERNKHIIDQVEANAHLLEPVILELVTHFWLIDPEEDWYSDIPLLVELFLEAGARSIDREIIKLLVGAATSHNFTSWSPPSETQLDAFAKDAAWILTKAALDEQYGESGSSRN